MVTIRDLHFAYRRKPVFKGLNLDLEPGYIYGLLGRNGTGKSTLLRNLAGLLYPGRGKIVVNGLEPRNRQPASLEKVFLVPEEFYVPPVPVKRWVASHAPFYPNFSLNMLRRTLEEFSIAYDDQSKLTELSFGQQKKVLIALALSVNTPLLLMDEPTNALDILSKSQFRKVMAGALTDEKCILISTHQVKDLENLIDRVAVIEDGKILFNQPMEKISRKLQFKLSFDPEETARALYSETSLKGNAVVLEAETGDESFPDLEMLYKAVVLQPALLNKALEK
jgi:ABC-2 type transport system ATP-binding protein